MHQGYAVVDLETTGFSPAYHHRVIEIGIVLVTPEGCIEGELETVLNPNRDLGPTEVHRLRGADMQHAPKFGDVVGGIVDALRGRVLVAHNVRFEIDFLTTEFAKLGLSFPLTAEGAICTMRLSSIFLPGSGRKLADCCAAYDIELLNAHEALADARATAALLAAYLQADPTRRAWWEQWGVYSASVSWPTPTLPHAAWAPRQRHPASTPLAPLEQATNFLPAGGNNNAERQYLAMLDLAVADQLLTIDEADQLAALATSLEIGARHREELHAHYFDQLTEAVWADGALSPAEAAQLQTVATLLDIPNTRAETATRRPTTTDTNSTAAAPTTLGSGSIVVLTGAMRRERSLVEADIRATGATIDAGVTKKTTALIAADPDSLSGKARKARQYGIPILSEDDLVTALQTRVIPRN